MTANRRLPSVVWSLGLIVLAVGGLGYWWHFGPSQPVVGLADSPSKENGAAGIVCFGLVDLEHGCTPLYPVQPGRVARVPVQENDHAAAAAPLLYLEDQIPRLRVDEARDSLAVAQTQLATARNLVKRHTVHLDLQKLAVSGAEARLAAARAVLTRKQQLESSHSLNRLEVVAAEEQVKEVEAALAAERQKMADLQLQEPELDVQRALAGVSVAQTQLRLAEQVLADCILKAPCAGTVVRVQVTPGEILGTSPVRPAIVFAPDEPRIVRAEVEQEVAGRVAVGQAVQVQDDLATGILGEGTITRLSNWYLPRRTFLLDPARFNDTRTLECVIKLGPTSPSLRIGQRVRLLIQPSG
jgi:multidrug resistance efflux pump